MLRDMDSCERMHVRGVSDSVRCERAVLFCVLLKTKDRSFPSSDVCNRCNRKSGEGDSAGQNNARFREQGCPSHEKQRCDRKRPNVSFDPRTLVVRQSCDVESRSRRRCKADGRSAKSPGGNRHGRQHSCGIQKIVNGWLFTQR